MTNKIKKTFNDLGIGEGHPPYLIAEMSGNHGGSLEHALKIVDRFAALGASAIKLQTYTADTMTLDLGHGEFFVSDEKSLWKGEKLYSLYEKASTPWEWHAPIFERCQELGVHCFSSPFDETAVDLLEKLDAPMYKVASFEITDLPLIKLIGQTGKPAIISTGMAGLAEIEDALNAFYGAGGKEVVLLKCTSSYPSGPEDSHLRTIPAMRDIFHVPVGLSDHTLGVGIALGAIALGACVIEKHVVLSREDNTVDSAFSLTPDEFAILASEAPKVWKGLGNITFGPNDGDRKSLVYRRSLYIAEDVKAGEVLNTKNLRRIRPGLGLPCKYFEILLGKKVNRAMSKGTPLSWNNIAHE